MIYRSGNRLCNGTLLQRCGSGAYGEMCLAEDAIGTRVALKILFPVEAALENERLQKYLPCLFSFRIYIKERVC